MLVGRSWSSAAPTRVSPAARTRLRPLQTCAPSRQSAKASMPPPMRRQYRSSSACHCRFARTEGSAAVSSADHRNRHPHALAPVAIAAKARDPGRSIWSPTLELLALLNGGQSTGGAFPSGCCATPAPAWAKPVWPWSSLGRTWSKENVLFEGDCVSPTLYIYSFI